MAWETRKDLKDQEVEIRGKKVKFRLLTAPELLDAGAKFSRDDDGDLIANFRDIAPIIAPAIIEIEGFERYDYKKLLTKDLRDIGALMEIIRAVLNASSLSEDEAKNSVSSPDLSSVESARSDAATTTKASSDSVSTTPTPSFSSPTMGE